MPNTNPLGSVVSLHRYPVKSMMGEELSTVEVGGRGLLGDRGYALIDSADGKAATAKNPRKWPHLFAFGAALIAPGPASGGGTVRITLPDGTTVTSDQRDCNRILSKAVLRQNAGVIDTVDFRCRGARHLAAMMLTILRLLSLILAAFRLQSELALENLALRQQLAVVHRQHRRPRLRKSDRVFWLLLSRSWSHWKHSSSSSPKRSCAGTGSASLPTGRGYPGGAGPVDQKQTMKSGS